MMEGHKKCELSTVFESMWGGYKEVGVRLMRVEGVTDRWHEPQMTSVCTQEKNSFKVALKR